MKTTSPVRLPILSRCAFAFALCCLAAGHAKAAGSEVIELRSITDFAISQKDPYVPAYKDNNNQALAIDAAKYKDKFAAGQATFPGPPGIYDVVLTTLAETDGESTYQLLVQGRKVGESQNPKTEDDYAPAQRRWNGVELKQGDQLTLAFNTHSNGRTPEGTGFAYSRGRWRSLAFVRPGAAYALQEQEEAPAPDKDASAYFQFEFNPSTAKNVFEEKDGLVVVEAEHFALQTHDSVRKWRLTTRDQTPQASSDGAGNHAANASGGAYLEILLDTRRNHSEPLIPNGAFAKIPAAWRFYTTRSTFIPRAGITSGRGLARPARKTMGSTWGSTGNGQAAACACSGLPRTAPGFGIANKEPRKSIPALTTGFTWI